MTLGSKIKALRERCGWTQQALSQRAHGRQALLSALETEKQTDTTGSVLWRLALTLGVSVAYLVGMSNGLVAQDTPSPGHCSSCSLLLKCFPWRMTALSEAGA